LIGTLLLILSNVFFNLAWYSHLKHPQWPYLLAVCLSLAWAIPEYLLHVQSSRMSYGPFSLYQIRILNMILSIAVFIGFAHLYFGEKLTWRYAIAFMLLLAAGIIVFTGSKKKSEQSPV